MDGEQTNAEILRAIGSLESAVNKLSEDMGKICEFKDELLATRQEFEDYKEGRRLLPEKITLLEGRANMLEANYNSLKTLAEATASEVGTLKKWANQASGIQLTIQAAIFVLVAITPLLIWWLQ